MLMGRYDYTIDAKGRLSFPAEFREELGCPFVVTQWLDDCLVAFSQQEFAVLAERIGQRGMVKGRDIQRFLFSAAAKMEPDKQGRILLPAKLREHAHITKNVTVLGNRNHAEIWDTALWERYQEQLDSAEIQAAMEELEL